MANSQLPVFSTQTKEKILLLLFVHYISPLFRLISILQLFKTLREYILQITRLRVIKFFEHLNIVLNILKHQSLIFKYNESNIKYKNNVLMDVFLKRRIILLMFINNKFLHPGWFFPSSLWTNNRGVVHNGVRGE